jgi:hypothetical protein
VKRATTTATPSATLIARAIRLQAEPPVQWETALLHIESQCGFTRCLAEAALCRHQGLGEKQSAAHLRIPLTTFRGRIRRIYTEHGIGGAVDLVLLVERVLQGIAAASATHA